MAGGSSSSQSGRDCRTAHSSRSGCCARHRRRRCGARGLRGKGGFAAFVRRRERICRRRDFSCQARGRAQTIETNLKAEQQQSVERVKISKKKEENIFEESETAAAVELSQPDPGLDCHCCLCWQCDTLGFSAAVKRRKVK